MKKIYILTAFSFLYSLLAVGQVKIPISEASKHYGETVSICDKVYGGKFMESSKKQITLINVGGAYPNHKLTIQISSENRKNFKDKPEDVYINKTVCVTGKLVEFNGRPEIIISRPEEIEIQSEESGYQEIKPNDFFKFQ